MRLLNTRDLRFEEFYESPDDSNTVSENGGLVDTVPAYAILTHRWGVDEVSYQEFLHLTSEQDAVTVSSATIMSSTLERKKYGAGYDKIMQACKYAQRNSLDWIWIDTCCIDKSSSAELSEAINSMWKWYKGSKACYAHLIDVEDGLLDADEGFRQFRLSEWFFRGWPLQELLAPVTLEFLDRDWKPFGSKHSLCDLIEEITGISVNCLRDPHEVRDESVNTKMRWASRRKTTRIEDQAYCLMGIFDINMTLLYGEGSKAFLRLQKEIIANCDDQTVLAHIHPEATSPLAARPSDFDLGYVVENFTAGPFMRTELFDHPLSVTTKGIQLRAAFVGAANSANKENRSVRVIALGCYNPRRHSPFLLEIELSGSGSHRRHWIVQHISRSEKHSGQMSDALGDMQKFAMSLEGGSADPFIYETITLVFCQQ